MRPVGLQERQEVMLSPRGRSPGNVDDGDDGSYRGGGLYRYGTREGQK